MMGHNNIIILYYIHYKRSAYECPFVLCTRYIQSERVINGTHHARNVTSLRFFRAIIVINFVTSMNNNNNNKNSTGVIDFRTH